MRDNRQVAAWHNRQTTIVTWALLGTILGLNIATVFAVIRMLTYPGVGYPRAQTVWESAYEWLAYIAVEECKVTYLLGGVIGFFVGTARGIWLATEETTTK